MKQRGEEVGRQDAKAAGNRLNGCDDLIATGRAIEHGARARTEYANNILRVRPIEQNNQGCPIVSASIVGQQLTRRGVRQDGINVVFIDQFPEGARPVDNPHEDDGRVIAWQLFEVATQDRID